MSVGVNTSSLDDKTPEVNCQLLPCDIEYDGQAKVSEYFVSTLRNEDEDGKEYQTASFRGRPLQGCDVQVPSGYIGLVFKETMLHDDEQREIQVTGKFKEFKAWNLDSVPSESDGIRQAMEWMDVADTIHEPVQDVKCDTKLKD